MSTISSLRPEGDAAARRKLRKGTSSCKECKRRKIRCLFAAADDVTCISCQRRGIACLSQEFGDELLPQDDDPSMRGRLIRVERLLETMLRTQEHNCGNNVANGSRNELEGTLANLAVRTNEAGPPFRRENAQLNPYVAQTTQPEPQRPEANLGCNEIENNERIRGALYAALSSQHIANKLIDGRFSIYLQILCNSYNILQQGNLLDPSILAQLPELHSHPVLLSRKLLQLAVCLQQLAPDVKVSSMQLPDSPLNLMTKYVRLASDLVTSNDRLLDSIEGMECLIIEGVYLINSGNLRRAWFCFRKATTMAQFLGFHRGTPRSLKVLDPNTRASCSVIWTRIVYAERYLSLILGMPSSINQTSPAGAEEGTFCTPTEKLDAIHAVVCGLVIERNQSDFYHDYTSTQRIDNDLQMVAKSVLPEWWAAPDLSQATEISQVMEDIIRAQTQIIHFNVLTLLHLPYMLSHSAGRKYDYSKIMCIHASREVLSRQINFRGFVKAAFCCRLVDFCALTAALTLLLGHLEARRNGLCGVLMHQRTSDRALIEKAMDTMDELNQANNDLLSKETAAVIRKLLAFEAEALNSAGIYSISRIDGESSSVEQEPQAFHMKVPFFGTVSIGRKLPTQPQQYQSLAPSSSYPDISGGHSAGMYSSSMPDYFGTDLVNFGVFGGVQIGRPQPSLQSSMDGLEEMMGLTDPIVSFQEYASDQASPSNDFIANADDWAFQGVDTTFFNAVLQGDLVDWNGSII